MTINHVSAQQVWEHLWDRLKERATFDGATICVPGASAACWVRAEQRDGEWTVSGFHGDLGDTTRPGPVTIIAGRSTVMSWFAAAAGEATDPASEVGWALTEALRTFERDVRLTPLTVRFPTLRVDSYGGACPVQAEGTIAGHAFYFRYRSGCATLGVGGEDGVSDYHWHATIEHGEQYDGFLEDDEFIDLFTRLVAALAPAPFAWEFEGVQTGEHRLTRTKAGEKTQRTLWGNTPQEAWTTLAEQAPPGITLGEWLDYIDTLGLDPRPVNVDTRGDVSVVPDWTAPAGQ